ncbi:MAG: BatA domain-containing protein, partial [Gemmatimonadota bacterium]
MGALNPLFLAAAVAVAVPIFLHLFQRHETRRFSFPALRYLERTEKEHARRIKLRQLLLLLLRVAILLLLVGAGARLVVSGRGASHPPTAVAIVLDNSLSSGLVVGETRILDRLKGLARQALDQATTEDRFWVIRAGEPWLPAIPGGAAEARTAVDETEPSDGAGDLTAALQRATELLRTSDLAEREIHLLSDMQRTGFELPGGQPAADLPVVAWEGDYPAEENRAITSVLVGGGLPPLEGQRSALTVQALSDSEDTTSRAVRVVIDGRVRAAGELSAGAQASIALPPTGAGWITGYADADPDALRADDRRYFAYRSRSAPSVSVGGTPGLFLGEAISVLERSGRVEASAPGSAELIIAQEGIGLDGRGRSTAALVVPPDDPTLLPALNRRLTEAGIAWRYQPRSSVGAGELDGSPLPEALLGTRVTRWYEIEPTGEAGAARPIAEIA